MEPYPEAPGTPPPPLSHAPPPSAPFPRGSVEEEEAFVAEMYNVYWEALERKLEEVYNFRMTEIVPRLRRNYDAEFMQTAWFRFLELENEFYSLYNHVLETVHYAPEYINKSFRRRFKWLLEGIAALFREDVRSKIEAELDLLDARPGSHTAAQTCLRCSLPSA